ADPRAMPAQDPPPATAGVVSVVTGTRRMSALAPRSEAPCASPTSAPSAAPETAPARPPMAAPTCWSRAVASTRCSRCRWPTARATPRCAPAATTRRCWSRFPASSRPAATTTWWPGATRPAGRFPACSSNPGASAAPARRNWRRWRRSMDVRLDTVDIAVDGERLLGTVLAPARRLPGILFVHGWGGSQEHDLARAREAAGLGCVCLTFDLRGHEATAGQWETVSRAQNLDDLLAAFDWLAAPPLVAPASVAGVGTS